MIHSYPKEYFELYSEAKNGYSFRRWNLYVECLASNIEDFNVRNKLKGDMLEVFAEIFFNVFSADEGVGLYNYKPVEIGDDYGVDATGVNPNGRITAVQVKYRSNPTELISYGDIARTFTSAVLQLNLEDVLHCERTVYLFTNCNGVTGAFEKVMQNKTVIINRDIISHKVDNNITFWEKAYDMIFQTLDT